MAEAQRVVEVVDSFAFRRGYTLALYGSVMRRGRGRDVDLLALPFRPGASTPDQLLEDIERLLLAERLDVYDGLDGSRSFLLRSIEDGLLVDIRVLQIPVVDWGHGARVFQQDPRAWRRP